MFKELGNLATMMRQAQNISGRMQEVSERLKHEKVSASAGGGMVEVEVNGLGEVLNIKIDPELVNKGDREMIEDLIPGAVNQAVAKAKEAHAAAVQAVTDDLDVPGLSDALAKFTGDGGIS